MRAVRICVALLAVGLLLLSATAFARDLRPPGTGVTPADYGPSWRELPAPTYAILDIYRISVVLPPLPPNVRPIGTHSESTGGSGLGPAVSTSEAPRGIQQIGGGSALTPTGGSHGRPSAVTVRSQLRSVVGQLGL